MFDDLTELAYDRSPARRAELLGTITDLFVSAGPRVDAGAAQIYADILARLMPRLTLGDQIELAERLAGMPTAPHAAIVRLAHEDIDLADSVLRVSRVLTDADLIGLAAVLPQSHLAAIAARQPLSEGVTDALIRYGDAETRLVLTKNRSARFSPEGLLGMVVGVSVEGLTQSDAGMQPKSAEILRFPATPVARPRHAAPQESAGRILAWPVRAVSAPVDGPEADSTGRPVASVIAAVASDDRMLEVAMLLAEHAGLPVALVSRLIARPDPTLLAVLCKAAEVSSETFSVIARIRGCRFGHSEAKIVAACRIYETLSTEEAEQALRFMQAHQSEHQAATGQTEIA